jgi:hypothetical protein
MLKATRRLGFIPEKGQDGLTRVILEFNA